MVVVTNKKWILKQHPDGHFDPEKDVELVEEELDLEDFDCTQIEPDHVLIKVHMYSVDAFVRTMLDKGAFHGTITPGKPLLALGYATIVKSKSSKFRVDQKVVGMFPVANYAVVKIDGLTSVMQFPRTKPSLYLGLLGISGLTAYTGMFLAPPTGGPKAKETVVISAASGAVGCVCVQLAKLQGCRVVGIAGGTKKCRFLSDTLKCDAVVDYKDDAAGSLEQRIQIACPNGIDFYFDNVGGPMLDAVLKHINTGARIVICGAISQYSSGTINSDDDDDDNDDSTTTIYGPKRYIELAKKNATMVGFTLMHYMSSVSLRGLPYLLMQYYRGNLDLPEHVEEGVESFPKALGMLFDGGHIGRLLVDVDKSLSSE